MAQQPLVPVLNVDRISRQYPFAFACFRQLCHADPVLDLLSPVALTHHFAHYGSQPLYSFFITYGLPIVVERVSQQGGSTDRFTGRILSQKPLQRFANCSSQRAAEVAVLEYAFSLLEQRLHPQGEHSTNHFTSWVFVKEPHPADSPERYLEVKVCERQGPLFTLRLRLYLN